jgi:hypothetical protein
VELKGVLSRGTAVSCGGTGVELKGVLIGGTVVGQRWAVVKQRRAETQKETVQIPAHTCRWNTETNCTNTNKQITKQTNYQTNKLRNKTNHKTNTITQQNQLHNKSSSNYTHSNHQTTDQFTTNCNSKS